VHDHSIKLLLLLSSIVTVNAIALLPTADADDLVFSTFLNGSGYESIRDIVLDENGDAFIVGGTNSYDFPSTPGALQTRFGGGPMDAFVAKISGDGSSVIWYTYLGGSKYDAGFGVGLDRAGNVYVVGRTSSTDYPTTRGAYDRTYNGGLNREPWYGGDAFVSKVSPDGSKLLYSTYLGGKADEWAVDVAVEPNTGRLYLVGATKSTDFPSTSGAFDRDLNRSLWDAIKRKRPADAFVVKLSADGTRLLYSTYLGGSAADSAEGVAINGSGSAYVTGYTFSSNFPTTKGAFQRNFGGSTTDVWVAKVSPEGTRLVYSTLIGGAGNDGVEHSGIIVDGDDHAYVSGFTRSSNFPTTSGVYQRNLRGSIDSYLIKISTDGRNLIFSTLYGGSNRWESPFGSPGLDSDRCLPVNFQG
jgi:hypothetical protein